MKQTGRHVRLLPLFGTLALATAGLTSSVNAEEHRVLGLADIQTPAPMIDYAPTLEQPATLAGITPDAIQPEFEDIGSGMASYYGNELAGRRTASGEKFNPRELTAAHRSLPFGSKVRVTSRKSGKSVIVRINDRGPFTRGRLIDLSEAAAREIGLTAAGHGQVTLALLDR